MNPPDFTSCFGRQLWQWLPEVYRTRDVEGHLVLYLDACGELLDGIRILMERRLADSFPGGIDDAHPSQDWVLPYFGDLLDVRLRSPYPRGRRRELERAVAWR